jgi:hypothetical protein
VSHHFSATPSVSCDGCPRRPLPRFVRTPTEVRRITELHAEGTPEAGEIVEYRAFVDALGEDVVRVQAVADAEDLSTGQRRCLLRATFELAMVAPDSQTSQPARLNILLPTRS